MPLTPKQARFVRAYAKTLNGTQAVLDAGYAAKDRQQASQTAWRVMKNPQVREAIQGLEERGKLDNSLSAKRVLEELRRIAFVDVRELYDDEGRLKPIKDWSSEHGAAVQQLDVVSNGNADKGDGKRDRVLKVRTWDKTKALEMLAKHYALTVERTEISGGITVSWLPPQAAATPVVEGTVVKALGPGDDDPGG
jgi:phage terminase small subunit